MAERGGVREKVLQVVLVAGGVLGALGGGATSAVAMKHGDDQHAEQGAAHAEILQRLDKAADRERESAQRLEHLEADVGWLVRMLGAQSSEKGTSPPRLGKR